MQRPGNIFNCAQPNRFALRRWAAALSLVLGFTSHGEPPHQPGYLPAVGPAPLRFLAMMTPPTNTFKLPPPPPPVVADPEVKIPAPTNNTESVVTKVSSAPPVQTNEIGGTGDLTPDGVVSPQMLLKFFNKSTNGPSTTVIAPMDFRPPNPTPLPSKATYSTGP